jgi:UDP-sugar transporter A1/2/3
LSGIILIEISKLAISSICVMHSDTGPSLWEGFSGTLLTASNNTLVSAVLFTVATVLQSMGVHYLDLIPYLVLSQLKTLVTPVFARIILNQKYPLKNWIFIALMSLGIVLAQLGSSSDKTSAKGLKVQSMMRGAIVMLLAGVCVAIGSLCIEKTMKRSGRLFLCNAQLAAYSSTFALFYFCWFTKFSFGDFFRGFDIFVWIYLVLQVSGGFLVARCVQMTSTVTKNYAQGLGFVLAVVVPRLVTHQHISLEVKTSKILAYNGCVSLISFLAASWSWSRLSLCTGV